VVVGLEELFEFVQGFFGGVVAQLVEVSLEVDGFAVDLDGPGGEVCREAVSAGDFFGDGGEDILHGRNGMDGRGSNQRKRCRAVGA